MLNVAILVSGRGSNLQAIIDYFDAREALSPVRLALVASNRAAAPALDRARTAQIPAFSFTADDEGAELIDVLRIHAIDLVVLAGYMKKVPAAVVREYHGRIVNVHPGLLPQFGGPGMYGAKVHAAVLESGAKSTGVTVHLVDDEYDHGPVIAQWRVPVLADDTPETLAARVLEVEHLIYPRAIEMVAALNDRKFFADF